MTASAILSNLPGTVRGAIASASRRTGVDFNYLLGQAHLESGLNPRAQAATSSAKGLYQFIDQSWLAVVNRHGGEHGLGWAANAIQKTGGRYVVADPATRDAIMNLRTDPQAAALMAAEHAADNKSAVERCLGRPASGTDLYLCHFLGQKGGVDFLSAMASNGDRPAASLFPAAARSNRNVFYAGDGTPRSLEQVYGRFATKLGNAVPGAGNALPADLDVLGPGLKQEKAGEETNTLERLTFAAAAPATGSMLRPSPDNARLAYLMLATLGN